MMKAKAILFRGVNQVTVEPVEIPEPGPGEVLLETICTCVSPGTELRCLAGQQADSGQTPFIPGYANVGRVIQRGAGVDVAVGTLAFGSTTKASVHRLWGAHVSHSVRPAADLIMVPDGVSPAAAALGRLMAIAYHGARLANARPDESVAVVGLGPIGMFAALMANLTGGRVVGFDLFAERVALAKSVGLEAVRVEGDLVATAKKIFPDGADVVVDSTGAAAVLPQSARIGRIPPWDVVVRDLPRLVVQGSYPQGITLDYHDVFFRENIVLFPRDQTAFDLRAVLELTRRGRLQPEQLVGPAYRPEQAPEVYRILREQPQQMLTAVFEWK